MTTTVEQLVNVEIRLREEGNLNRRVVDEYLRLREVLEREEEEAMAA